VDTEITIALIAVVGPLVGAGVTSWLGQRKSQREGRSTVYVEVVHEVLTQRVHEEDWLYREEKPSAEGRPIVGPIMDRKITGRPLPEKYQLQARLHLYGTPRMIRAFETYLSTYDARLWMFDQHEPWQELSVHAVDSIKELITAIDDVLDAALPWPRLIRRRIPLPAWLRLKMRLGRVLRIFIAGAG
jgi:hypothetical protein